jgi:signal transduction histidine kinase/ABC-type nitrate/sulfonate/bicarbonate transport system substrate-binding protein
MNYKNLFFGKYVKKSALIILLFITTLFSNNKQLEKVSLQLMWLDQFEFAGFYIAKEKGYYKNLGLDVEFKKFTFDKNIVNDVEMGKTTFGLSSSSLLIDIANGSNINLLGAIFQSSPLALLSLKESNITSIEDIKNKTIMLSTNQELYTTIQALLTSKRLILEDMNIIEHSFDIDDLINKKVDVMSIFTTNQPFILKEKGYEVNILNPKDFGFDFYEDILFTSKIFAKNNPKVVNAFFKATIKGWEYAINNMEESVNLVYNKYNPQNKSLNALKYEANEIKKLLYSPKGNIGEITKEKIKLIEQAYKVMGFIQKDLNFEQLFFNSTNEQDLKLDENELSYLKNKKMISMCIDPNWMPYEKNHNGEHIGITADYMKYIESKINTPIKMVQTKTWIESLNYGEQRKCDIFSLVMQTKERKKYLDFTQSYLKNPLVLASNLEDPFISKLSQLNDKRLGIVKGYAYGEILKKEYPNISFIEVENIKDGLKKIQSKKIYGFIDTLATVGYQIQKDYIGQLKISGKFDINLDLRIGTRNDEPLLHSIFNKVIKTIDEKKHQEIFNKWVSITYENKGLSHKELIKLLGILIAFILILVLLYRQYLVNNLNKTLEIRIEEEIQKNNEHHKLMNQQAKMASMGEMIGNIAHQWRQPLSMISVTATGIKLKKEFDTLSDTEFNDAINSINHSAQFLSKTIDDFRNFYSEDKKSSTFFVKDIIEKSFSLISAQFTNQDITIVQKIDNIQINTIENELLQVLINILNNAKDALSHQEKEKFIFIDIYKDDNSIFIAIKDNAGGINSENMDKIFEPYFTTKHKSQGTGIGLYMCQQMLVNHMEGSLIVSNKEFYHNLVKYKGAQFTIELPFNLK